ncbi:MAG TPA: Rid family detoxifying hydrolase [Polyangiaceae bacterium]
MNIVRTSGAPAPKGPYSQGRKGGGLVFVAGQGPFDATGKMLGSTIEEQTRATLENVKAIVEAAGATLADVVKVNVYLSDLAHFAAMNEVYASFFAEPYPARTTVQAGLLGFLVEIDAIAALPE